MSFGCPSPSINACYFVFHYFCCAGIHLSVGQFSIKGLTARIHVLVEPLVVIETRLVRLQMSTFAHRGRQLIFKNRLVVKYKEVLYTTITVFYGLTQRCQLQVTQTDDGKFSYRNYECRQFPTREDDHCDRDEYKSLCNAWTSTYYLDQIAIGIGAVALVAVLFGVITHSTRRRMWKTVAGLVFLVGKHVLVIPKRPQGV